MLDALNRWFSGTPPPAKAETGPFVYNIGTYPPISSLTDNPVTKIEEAQALFRRNPWVARAERTIVGRYVNAPWHLEDSQGNTVGDTGPAKVAKDLIENPDPQDGDIPGQSRKRLWSLTMRHQGLTGNGFWYLDQRLPNGGPPLRLLYINPARMTPVENEAGKLIGWVMDHPQNPVSQRRNLRKPVPFERNEVRHFILDEPDWGHYGIGVAEAAYNHIELERLATHHAAGVFATGGRLAGLVSPKQGVQINDEQWASLVRDWRNVAGDANAAKRLIIAKGPVDLHDTTANPSELQLIDLLKLGRDDIFGAWGIPLSQGPAVMEASGLNSGEHVKYEEAALWQGPIEERSGHFEEQVQSVIDLFGLGLKLVVEKPAFDDQLPLFQNAEKATKQPLTNNERRALLGFDPLDDEELGAAIYIEKTMVRIEAEPEPETPFAPFTPVPVSEETATPEDSGLGEASQPVKAALRDNTAKLWEPRLREVLQVFLSEQAASIANRVKNNYAHISKKPMDVKNGWWDERRWDAKLQQLLEPLLGSLADSVGRKVRPTIQAKAGWIDTVTDYVKLSAAKRITGINRTTRDEVARLVAQGIEAGLSPADLAQTIREAATFSESRSELIARTETALAYNEAALSTYRTFEVAEVQAIDGDQDAECAARNGNVYSVDEAFSITDHPNGTLDWVPVVSGKAEGLKAAVDLPGISIPLTVNVPEIVIPENPPANVTVHVPKPDPVVVNLPEVKVPDVTVNVPEQPVPQVTVEAAKATTPQEVIVTSMPERFHKVLRDKKGQVTGSLEVDD